VARKRATENGVAPRASHDAPEAGGEDLGRLTERQLQILALVARGLTNRQVGEALGISELTVRNHMRAVLRKLHSRDRTQAVVTALSAGWIAIPIDATGAPLATHALPTTERRG
jgi:DNA-binding NarL/FixJ family response regulator